uniref:Uncharacterized protein n=1 Tax=Arundo donax TaxID=35708 RepID=A0A0A8YX16_ARUDO
MWGRLSNRERHANLFIYSEISNPHIIRKKKGKQDNISLLFFVKIFFSVAL